MLISSNQIQEYNINYSDSCSNNNNCSIHFTIDKEINSPIFLYYELDNFYQNHRKYLKSKNSKQLLGEAVTNVDTQSCSPKITNKEMGKNISFKGKNLSNDEIAYPCGLIAFSFFNG